MAQKTITNSQIMDILLTMNAAISNLTQTVNDLNIRMIKVEERLTKIEARIKNLETTPV